MGRFVGILLGVFCGFIISRCAYSSRVEIREVEVPSNCPEPAPVSDCKSCISMVVSCTENYSRVYELLQKDVQIRNKLQEDIASSLKDALYWEQRYKEYTCE